MARSEDRTRHYGAPPARDVAKSHARTKPQRMSIRLMEEVSWFSHLAAYLCFPLLQPCLMVQLFSNEDAERKREFDEQTANYVVWNVLSVATRTAFSIFHSKASHALAASGATWRTWLSRVLSALLYWLVQVGTPVNLHGNFKQGFPRSSPRYFFEVYIYSGSVLESVSNQKKHFNDSTC